MKTLRVAQITDIHLLAEPNAKLHGVDTAIALQKVIDAIGELSPLPDLMIATGDLAEDGSKATYSRLRHLLAPVDIPVYVLAGNHDVISEMHVSLVDENINFINMARVGKWNFMFVNSQVVGESYGFISADELSLLKANLELAGDAPVVVALHHTPMQICPRASCQLQNVSEFNRLMHSFPGIKAVIAGHTHVDAEKINASHIQYTTPSTFAQFNHGFASDSDAGGFWASHTMDGSSHGFRVLDLKPDGQIASQVHWLFDS
jgi:Icc protein